MIVAIVLGGCLVAGSIAYARWDAQRRAQRAFALAQANKAFRLFTEKMAEERRVNEPIHIRSWR